MLFIEPYILESILIMINAAIISKKEKFRSDTAPSPGQVKEYTEKMKNRTRRILEGLIDYSHMTRGWIESDLGYSNTYFAKLLAGKIELRVDHITSICKLLEFPVTLFWAIVFEDETINFKQFENGVVKRMRGLLVYIYGDEPNELAKALGHIEPKRDDMEFKPYSFAESRKY